MTITKKQEMICENIERNANGELCFANMPLSALAEKYGKNKLREGKKHGFIYKFFQQMKDMMKMMDQYKKTGRMPPGMGGMGGLGGLGGMF